MVSILSRLLLPVLMLTLTVYAETVETGLISAVPEDGSVNIENINGEIHLIPGGDDSSVTVEWTITCADGEDPGAVEVLHDATDGLHVWTELLENRSIEAVVDYQVSVPAGSDYEYLLETVNGDIDVLDCGGTALISIVNGDIETSGFDGVLWLELVNGSIAFEDCPGVRTVELVNGSIQGILAPMESDITLEAVNGDIEVGIPEGAALVSVETVSGSIDLEGYEDAVIVTEVLGESAEFGEGEFSVVICTVSGDIEVSDTE